MRKHCRFLGLALLAAAALVSCTREEILPVEPETPEEKPVEKPTTHTIMVTASNSEDTRTQIGADNMSSLWSAGDKLLVFQGCLSDYYGWYPTAVESGEGTMSDGGKKMVFPVDFDYEDPETLISGTNPAGEPFKFLYRAAYPAENALLDTDEGCYLVVNALSSQCPTETSFDPKADILTSQPVFLMEQPDNLNLAFKRQTALGQMTVKGLPEGAKLYGVYFYPDTDIPDTFAMNLMDDDEGEWYGSDFGGVTLKIPGWTVPPAGSEGATAIMTSFMIPPFQLVEGGRFYMEVITREMVTDEDTGEVRGQLYDYWREVELGENRELVFTAGDLTQFSVNMANAGREGIPDFEVTFSDPTLDNFPHLNDPGDRYLEIPFTVGGGGGGGGGDPKKAKASPGDYIYLAFDVTHPWTVSFSESWLSASAPSGSWGSQEIVLYATLNNTGAPREATLTFTSDVYGEVNIRVVQESFSAPRSISLIAPQTVPAYTPFNPEVVLDTADPTLYNLTNIDWKSDRNIKRRDDGFVILAPGTYTFYAWFEVYSIGFYMESEPVTVTVTEPDAPTDWYFLVKRYNKPYLIHRNGGSDTAIKLSDYELAQANDLAVSSDGKVYIVGAYPDTDNDNVLRPCLWTYQGGETSRKVYSDWTNKKATKVAVDGTDYYILVSGIEASGASGNMVLKSVGDPWIYTPGPNAPRYDITAISAENGHFYLAGTEIVNRTPAGNSAEYWRDGVPSSLHAYTLRNTTYLHHPWYKVESIATSDGQIHVAGYVEYQYTDFYIFSDWLYWDGNTSPSSDGPSSWGPDTSGTFYMLHDLGKSYDHFILAGEHYMKDYNSQTSSFEYSKRAPVLFYDSKYSSISVTYSGTAGISEVEIVNGVPVLRGTLNEKPAFWEAPWKTPVVWNNNDDEMIGFAVK